MNKINNIILIFLTIFTILQPSRAGEISNNEKVEKIKELERKVEPLEEMETLDDKIIGENDSNNSKKKEKVQLVDIRIELSPKIVSEGSNIDIKISLTNLSNYSNSFLSPDTRVGSLYYEIFDIVNNKPVALPLMTIGRPSRYMILDANETFTYYISLFNDDYSIVWIKPGKYKINLVFIPMKLRQSMPGNIDWDVPISSNAVEFEVESLPNSLSENIKKAKKFLGRIINKKEDCESYLIEYNDLLSAGIESSLKKGLC